MKMMLRSVIMRSVIMRSVIMRSVITQKSKIYYFTFGKCIRMIFLDRWVVVNLSNLREAIVGKSKRFRHYRSDLDDIMILHLQYCLGPHKPEGPLRSQRPLADNGLLGWSLREAAFIKHFMSYLGWRDASINHFNRGLHSFRRIVVDFCVVSVIEFLRDAEPFQSLLAS
jgi:hypothetical protein